MKRSVALIASALVLGACGSSAARVPAVHAQVSGPHNAFDVWRDPKGRVTLASVTTNPSPVMRYDPSTHTLTWFDGQKPVGLTRYLSNRVAWAEIERAWGIPKSRYMRALASGSLSLEPASYEVSAPLRSSRSYSVSTDYGTNIARMAKETRLTIPRLASLGGYPFRDALRYARRDGQMEFGPTPNDYAAIGLVIAGVNHGPPDPAASWRDYSTYQRVFDARNRPHYRVAGVRYAIGGQGGVVFPYRGEWIYIDLGTNSWWGPAQTKQLASIIREIVTAPTS